MVVGNGGREHALAWKLAQSELCKQLFVAPGNPGIAAEPKVTAVPVDVTDHAAVVEFCKSKDIGGSLFCLFFAIVHVMCCNQVMYICCTVVLVMRVAAEPQVTVVPVDVTDYAAVADFCKAKDIGWRLFTSGVTYDVTSVQSCTYVAVLLQCAQHASACSVVVA